MRMVRVYRLARPTIALAVLIALTPADVGRACDNDTICPHNPAVMTIAIGLPLTGPFAAIGVPMKRGYETWASEVQSRGGIRRAKIQLEFHDDKGEASQFIAQTEQLIQRKVDVVLGPIPISAGLTLADRYKYPMIIPFPTSVESVRGRPYALMLQAPFEEYFRGAAEAAKAIGAKRVALVGEDAEALLPIRTGAMRAIKENGLERVADVLLKPGERDFANQAVKLKAVRVEAVFIVNRTTEEAIAWMRELRQALPNSMIVVRVGADTEAFKSALGSMGARVYRRAAWDERLNTPGNKEFVTRYKSQYNQSPATASALAYASGQLLERAITQEYSAEKRVYLRMALRQVKTATVLGKYELSKDGIQVGHQPLLIQQQEGDREEIVWPKEFATKPIQK